MIFFPQGGWQLHWLIVNDKLTLSPPRVRGWLPAEYLPDSHTDRLKCLYQHLPVGLSPDREPYPTPPHEHWWSTKARRCPEYSPSSCHHLNDASRGWRKDVGQSPAHRRVKQVISEEWHLSGKLSGIRSPFSLVITTTKWTQTLQYIDPWTCSRLLFMPEQSLPYKADLLHVNSRDSQSPENSSQSELRHPGSH